MIVSHNDVSGVICATGTDTGIHRVVTSPMPLYTGFIQLGAGLSVGLAGLAAGFAIGVVGDAGVRGTAQQGRLFVGMVSGARSRVQGECVQSLCLGRRLRCLPRIPDPHRSKPTRTCTDDMPQILILIFAEVLGLYGLIVALILNTKSGVTAYEVCQHSCLDLDQTDERI